MIAPAPDRMAIDRSPCAWDDFPARWIAAVGPQIARDARPAAFTLLDGTLTVVVTGALLLDELMAMRAALVAKLPVAIDGWQLRRIVFNSRNHG